MHAPFYFTWMVMFYACDSIQTQEKKYGTTHDRQTFQKLAYNEKDNMRCKIYVINISSIWLMNSAAIC